MSSDALLPAITARGLGKRYLIYDKPHHRLLQGLLRRPMHKAFWVLRNVDLDIGRGEAVGIIGRNGSGKSTLLQVLCGIFPPTEGTVDVNGRVAALLELGAGFNPEFSGRENVYVKASLLGLSRTRIDAEFARILAFAEIGDYIEQPVKTYSSGMFVRLAFAVAVHCDPDILVVDEALAVGDVYFQAKCQRRIAELRAQGCTLLFVTHSVDALAKLCDRVILLDDGRLIYDGDVRSAVAEYLRRVFGTHGGDSETDESVAVEPVAAVTVGEASGEPAIDARQWLAEQRGDRFATRAGYHRGEVRLGSGVARVEDFVFEGGVGIQPVFERFERANLLVRYHIDHPMERLVFGLQIRSAEDVLVYSTNTFFQSGEVRSLASDRAIAQFSFDIALLPGIYYLSIGVSRFDEHGIEIEALDRRMDSIIVTVLGRSGAALGVADLDAHIRLDELSPSSAEVIS